MAEPYVNLFVTNKTNPEQELNVKIDRTVTITNYNEEREPSKREVKTTIKDGKVQNIFVDEKGEKHLYRELNLCTNKYDIFNALRSLDGNAGDLTEDDCKKADTLIGQFGITSVDKSSGSKYKIILGEGKNDVLVIDFETKLEKMWNGIKNKYNSYCQEKEVEKEANKKERLQKAYEYCKTKYADKYDIELQSDYFIVTIKEDTNVWELASNLSADPGDIVTRNGQNSDIDLDNNDYLRSGARYLTNTDTQETGERMYKGTILHAGNTIYVKPY